GQPTPTLDRWVALGIFTDAQWRALVEAMGSPEWARDGRYATFDGRKQHEDELEARINEWTRDQVAEDVMRLLQSKGIPAGVVQNAKDVLEDEHLRALPPPEDARQADPACAPPRPGQRVRLQGDPRHDRRGDRRGARRAGAVLRIVSGQ